MVLFILALLIVVGIIVYAVKTDGEPGFGVILGALITAILMAGALTSNGKEISSEVIYTNPLIVVNGYYVDPSGNYVTSDNRHGTIELEVVGGLPASALSVSPILIETEHKYGVSATAMIRHTERKLSLALDGHYPE